MDRGYLRTVVQIYILLPSFGTCSFREDGDLARSTRVEILVCCQCRATDENERSARESCREYPTSECHIEPSNRYAYQSERIKIG